MPSHGRLTWCLWNLAFQLNSRMQEAREVVGAARVCILRTTAMTRMLTDRWPWCASPPQEQQIDVPGQAAEQQPQRTIHSISSYEPTNTDPATPVPCQGREVEAPRTNQKGDVVTSNESMLDSSSRPHTKCWHRHLITQKTA